MESTIRPASAVLSPPSASRVPHALALLCGSLLSVTAPSTFGQTPAPAERIEASTTSFAITAGDSVSIREGYRFVDPLPATTPVAPASGRKPEQRASSDQAALRHHLSAWISALSVDLIGDRDGDGYYRGFRLGIDVDTDAFSTSVYAIIYLQSAGSYPQPLHTTRSFVIEGTRRSDEYVLEIELLDNYHPDVYDIAIDIVDGFDGRLLDAVSAAQFSNLHALPLEAPDGVFFPGHPDHFPQNDGVAVTAYTGSAGYLWTLVLTTLLVARRWNGRARRARPYTLHTTWRDAWPDTRKPILPH